MIEIRHHNDDFIRVYFDDTDMFDITYEALGREGMNIAVAIVEVMARLAGMQVVHT